MADTVKQIGVKQQDGTYSMKDIEVDYSNVAGLSTQATSAKATADKNNKDITTYIASGSKNGENLVLTDGAGTTSNVDLSMTGATSNANGEAGFVPQPTSADVDKFLKADGSWATPPGEHYSGSSNINIDSSNVIDLKNTTVTSGTYGPSADVIGNNGTTILVPNISVDAKGRVTNITNKTYTSVDTGSKVFTGSLQEWDQLTIAQKKTYDFISNEEPGGTQGTFPADRVSYDNTVSRLTANDAQEAIDELAESYPADKVMFSDGVTSVVNAFDALQAWSAEVDVQVADGHFYFSKHPIGLKRVRYALSVSTSEATYSNIIPNDYLPLVDMSIVGYNVNGGLRHANIYRNKNIIVLSSNFAGLRGQQIYT